MLNVVVALYARDLALLGEFESEAVPIMRSHGAEVVLCFRPEGATRCGPHELHVLRFPSGQAFDAYRADLRLAALAGLRDRAIARTEVHLSETMLEY